MRTTSAYINLVSKSILFLLPLIGAYPLNAQEVNYKLINGDNISGVLVKDESSKDVKVIVSPLLGKIKINSSSIAQPKKKLKPPKVALKKKSSKWDREFSVGLNSSGTNKTINKNYAFDISTIYSEGLREKLIIKAD